MTLLETFSKWVDCLLKKVFCKILLTYSQEADQLMTELQCTFPNGLPPLFSVNAIKVYSNIDTKHGIQFLTSWPRDYRDDASKCMHVDFLIKTLAKIMRINIFQFDDTF
jgi:hypothetical protein